MRSMPPKKALELMLTGRRVDAAEADRIGFVTRVVPVADLDAALVLVLANHIGDLDVLREAIALARRRMLDSSQQQQQQQQQQQ